MGWEEDFLQEAVNTCTSETGRIEDCPLFNVVSEEKAKTCEMKIPSILENEDCKGPLKALPGSNGHSSGEKPDPTGLNPAPTLTYAPGQRPSNSASPLPGQIFKVSSAYEAPAPGPSSVNTEKPAPIFSKISIPAAPALLPIPTIEAVADVGVVAIESTPSVEAPVPTTTPAPEFVPVTDAKSFYSTQYITNGNVVSKILWEEEVVYVTDIKEEVVYVTVTSTTIATPSVGPVPGAAPVAAPPVAAPPAAAPARRRRRGAHLHGHGRPHF